MGEDFRGSLEDSSEIKISKLGGSYGLEKDFGDQSRFDIHKGSLVLRRSNGGFTGNFTQSEGFEQV